MRGVNKASSTVCVCACVQEYVRCVHEYVCCECMLSVCACLVCVHA